jgi:hypothetical protein
VPSAHGSHGALIAPQSMSVLHGSAALSPPDATVPGLPATFALAPMLMPPVALPLPPVVVPTLPALPGSSPLPISETPPHAANNPKLPSVIHFSAIVDFIGNPSFLHTVIPGVRQRDHEKERELAVGSWQLGRES